ncbi:TetR/AcrR family transcriptional regulator [Streptomyces glaucus]|uniref:HTH tetR-type domain-containing protein n=1 Tax=Streptomyces glaucus TaxID=284029 RepID=A0ABN3JBX5_9ACTN
MPSSTRRARERANIRAGIVETAMRLLESEGAAALTIRRIAADMEYTAPIVYQHFANKDALVLELVVRGYDQLLAELRRVDEASDIDGHIVRVAAQYVRFAGEHPHLYQAMNGTVTDADERRRAAAPAIDLLTELLDAWSHAHGVTLPDQSDACEILWGTLHGMAALGHLDTVGTERAQRLAEQACRTILLGWRATGSADGLRADSSPKSGT